MQFEWRSSNAMKNEDLKSTILACLNEKYKNAETIPVIVLLASAVGLILFPDYRLCIFALMLISVIILILGHKGRNKEIKHFEWSNGVITDIRYRTRARNGLLAINTKRPHGIIDNIYKTPIPYVNEKPCDWLMSSHLYRVGSLNNMSWKDQREQLIGKKVVVVRIKGTQALYAIILK